MRESRIECSPSETTSSACGMMSSRRRMLPDFGSMGVETLIMLYNTAQVSSSLMRPIWGGLGCGRIFCDIITWVFQ